MGCGNAKEKIENEMIAMKMERTKIQMERRNNIKLLEDIDGRKIEEPNIPDYLAAKAKEIKIDNKLNNISAKSKNSSKLLDIRTRSKSMDVKKRFKALKTNSTTAFEKKARTKKSSKRIIK